MFLTYLRRELRRRMRQAIIIAVGLALGIGLVIVVTSVSSGVKNAQASVLHSLYGEGTDITVTKTPTAGTGSTGAFGFRGQTGTRTRPAAGTTIDIDTLASRAAGTIAAAKVTTIAHLRNVAGVAGVDSDYATQNKLTVGSSITVAKTAFKVVGIVSTPAGSDSSDVYLPLA